MYKALKKNSLSNMLWHIHDSMTLRPPPRSTPSHTTEGCRSEDLSSRLFRQCEQRYKLNQSSAYKCNAHGFGDQELFFHNRILMFSRPSNDMVNIRSWAEANYGMEVLFVHERINYFSGLLYNFHSVDLIIVGRDSFDEDDSGFFRFIELVRDTCKYLPLIVLDRRLKQNEFVSSCSAPWDIGLTSPVSPMGIQAAFRAAANITVKE